MTLTCPECKNEVGLEQYPNLTKDQVVECSTCGITLLIKEILDEKVAAEIVDEGK